MNDRARELEIEGIMGSIRPEHDEDRTISVGELLDQLEGLDRDTRLGFGAQALNFARVKRRSPDYVQIEFGEVLYRDNMGRLIGHDPGSPTEEVLDHVFAGLRDLSQRLRKIERKLP